MNEEKLPPAKKHREILFLKIISLHFEFELEWAVYTNKPNRRWRCGTKEYQSCIGSAECNSFQIYSKHIWRQCSINTITWPADIAYYLCYVYE